MLGCGCVCGTVERAVERIDFVGMVKVGSVVMAMMRMRVGVLSSCCFSREAGLMGYEMLMSERR